MLKEPAERPGAENRADDQEESFGREYVEQLRAEAREASLKAQKAG
jgi:hypothetical protein